MSTDAHFWVKIGLKFQSLGKISNISTSDPPPVLLGRFQHWGAMFVRLHDSKAITRTELTTCFICLIIEVELARFSRSVFIIRAVIITIAASVQFITLVAESFARGAARVCHHAAAAAYITFAHTSSNVPPTLPALIVPLLRLSAPTVHCGTEWFHVPVDKLDHLV